MGKKSEMLHQTHLVRRGSVYYFRIAVPTDLLETYHPRREIKYSLKTRDRQLALKLAREHSLAITSTFERDRQQLPVVIDTNLPPQHFSHLSDAKIAEICDHWLAAVLSGDEQKRRQGISQAELQEMQASHDEIEADIKATLARGDISVIAQDLHNSLFLFGVGSNFDDDSYKRLAYAYLQTWRQLMAALQKRNAGEVVKTDTVVDPKRLLGFANAAPKQRPSTLPRLKELLDAWEKASTKRPGTVQDTRRVVNEVIALLGDKPADAITRKEIISYRDHLLQSDKLHPATVGKKIGMLHALFQQAVDDEKISANPAARIKIPKPKVSEKPRLPYSLDDVKTIFSCDIYIKGFRPPRAKVGEAAAWLPLLALYTGARMEELGQLLVSDFYQHPELGWYLDVIDLEDDEANKEAQDKRVKTDSSRRRVPLHPHLIKAGLLRYRDQINAQGHTRLFPKLAPDCKGVLTGNFSKWWSRYARRKIGMGEEKVFHSFRHTFKDACREAGLGEDLHDAVTGHAGSGGVGRTYGSSQYPLKPLFEAIKKIGYPGMVLPIIVPESQNS